VKILSLVILIIVALGVAYCIRSLRALHKKVSARSERTTREIAASTKELKAEVWQSYRQSEAMQQLLSLLKFSAPVPPTRSWAASAQLGSIARSSANSGSASSHAQSEIGC